MLSSLRSQWRHVTHNFQEGGLRQIFRKVAYRTQHWVRSEDVWWVYAIDLRTGAPEQDLGTLEPQTLDVEGMKKAGYFKADLFPEAMADRLAAGWTCHALFIGGKLANVGWTQMKALEIEPGVTEPVEGGGAIFDCYTLEAFRGQGIYPASLRLMLRYLRAHGADRALISVDPGNRNSIKGIERAGFHWSHAVVRRVVFGRQELVRDYERKVPA